jgi:hypothetical protein
VYHDYFDDADTSSLRNPYGPPVPLPAAERGSHRPRLLLAGVVGAGLSVVAGGTGPGRVVAADHQPAAAVPGDPAEG